jgi:hypothetical protein
VTKKGIFLHQKIFFISNFYKNRLLVLDLRGTIPMFLKISSYATLFGHPQLKFIGLNFN